MTDLNKKIEKEKAEMHELYCSEVVDYEVENQTELGLAFIQIENYVSMLEKKIKLIENDNQTR
jgi:hypothetical protein